MTGMKNTLSVNGWHRAACGGIKAKGVCERGRNRKRKEYTILFAEKEA